MLADPAASQAITVRDLVREVAPGVTQRSWTYDGTAPGPVLHGRVGDRFVIRLVNRDKATQAAPQAQETHA